MRSLPLLLASLLVVVPARAQSTSDEIDADGCPFSTTEALCIVGAGVAIGVGFLYAPALCADAPPGVAVGAGVVPPHEADPDLLQRRGVGVVVAPRESDGVALAGTVDLPTASDALVGLAGRRIADGDRCRLTEGAAPSGR